MSKSSLMTVALAFMALPWAVTGGDVSLPTLQLRRYVAASDGNGAANATGNATGNASKGSPGDVMTFYVYQAKSEETYPPANVNMGNLDGVLWYLHHEVVTACPRRFKITRILRYKVTYKTTPEMVALGMNFGWRYAFDKGACSDFHAGCVSKDYSKNGYTIGCNDFNDTWAYPADKDAKFTRTYPGGIWYSLPGACPSRKYYEEDSTCRQREPGGRCDSPTGAHDCTYGLEPKGEVSVDEVVGQGVHGVDSWWCQRGCREYKWGTDSGACTSFWNGFWSYSKSHARVERFREAFRAKYPDDPELPDPVCDFTPREGYFRS